MKHLIQWKLFESTSPSGAKLWSVNLDIEGIHGDYMESYIFSAKTFKDALLLIDVELGGKLTNSTISSVFPGFLLYSSVEEVNKNLAKDLLELGDVENPEEEASFSSADYDEIDFSSVELNNSSDLETFMRQYGRFVDARKFIKDEFGDMQRSDTPTDFDLFGDDKEFGSALAHLYTKDPGYIYFRLWNIGVRNFGVGKHQKIREKRKGKYEAFLNALKQAGQNFYDSYKELEHIGIAEYSLTSTGKLEMLRISKEEKISIPEAYASLYIENSGNSNFFSNSGSIPETIENWRSEIDPSTYRFAKAILRSS